MLLILSYLAATKTVREIFHQIPVQDFVAIAEYFGLREAMETRLLEMACERMDFIEQGL